MLRQNPKHLKIVCQIPLCLTDQKASADPIRVCAGFYFAVTDIIAPASADLPFLPLPAPAPCWLRGYRWQG